MRIGGADPGLNGAVGFIDTDAQTLAVYRMPTLVRQLATVEKNEIDGLAFTRMLQEHRPEAFWLEDVFARGNRGKGSQARSEGVVGAFSFGLGKGILVGVVQAVLGAQPHYVDPARWKREMRVPAEKQASKLRAIELLPACEVILTSEGKAEGALITLYGALQAVASVGLLRPIPAEPSRRRSGPRSS